MRVCVSVPFQIFSYMRQAIYKVGLLMKKGFCLNTIAVMTVIVTIVIVGLFLFMSSIVVMLLPFIYCLCRTVFYCDTFNTFSSTVLGADNMFYEPHDFFSLLSKDSFLSSDKHLIDVIAYIGVYIEWREVYFIHIWPGILVFTISNIPLFFRIKIWNDQNF